MNPLRTHLQFLIIYHLLSNCKGPVGSRLELQLQDNVMFVPWSAHYCPQDWLTSCVWRRPDFKELLSQQGTGLDPCVESTVTAWVWKAGDVFSEVYLL